MIDTTAKLDEFLVRLRAADWLALDTEADSLHAYPGKVCLIQVSLPGEDALIDPLAGFDLSPFWGALVGRELILHGADYDLRMLYRSTGFVPTAIFDTMLAARLIGIRQFGLTDLVGRFFGVRLDKASQKANWARRPLTDRMAAYAQRDTRHLKPLADALRGDLMEKGRLEWHRQTCAQLVRECTMPPGATDDEAWRIKGADRLTRRGLAIMRELWFWRDHEALAANRPPYFVLSHETLAQMAELAGQQKSIDPLIPPRYSPHRRQALLQAIARALALPDSRLPHLPRREGRRLTLAEKRQLEALRHRRDRSAAALGLDPALIASRATLVQLALDWERHSRALLPWQLALLRGHG